MNATPTEAEWEYACQAVSPAQSCFGDDDKLLGDYAWYGANSKGRTWPTGTKLPNLWGLSDLHGNLWEWCQDWYAADYYRHSPKADPPGPEKGDYDELGGFKGPVRVERGGSWYFGNPTNPSASGRDYARPTPRRSRGTDAAQAVAGSSASPG